MRAYKLDIIHWKQIITMSVVTHTATLKMVIPVLHTSLTRVWLLRLNTHMVIEEMA